MSKRFYITFLVVTLVIAALISGYASTHPDGLEYVAERLGFAHTAKRSSGPMSGYEVPGREGRLSGGAAGLIGALVTLALAGGLTWVLRRRGSGESR
ncbi:MAG TPA: PDGLE domain-containing protein [Marmoricola sp.]|nr:PDGLE domain-containing protein [Marmoricola sp.]